MKQILTALIMKFVTSLVTGKVMDSIKALVIAQTNQATPGPEKKALVVAELSAIKGEVGVAIAALSGSLLNLAIEAAVSYYKARK